ncbi:hypothetical protein ACFL5E_03075 [Candidatus Omnitrophota bacterium]
MEASKGVRVCGIAIIVFGIYNLLGVGAYKQFSMMFQPLPKIIILSLYLFTVFYGICGVYCGTKILRLEDWARKVIVALTTINVISSLLLNRTVMANFKVFIQTEQSRVPPEIASDIYIYAVVLTAVVTIFELSIIYFFTRPKVIEQFG